MTIQLLHHVSLQVADLERSIRFYREVFGLEEIARPPFPFPGAWFRLGDRELHLIGGQPVAPQAAQVDPRKFHVAVRVASFRATLEQLQALQEQYARELQEAGRMLQGSNAGGADRGGRLATPEGHEFSRSAPGTEAFKQDFARWDSLRKGMANAMDRYEAALAQRLAEREAAERVQAPVRDKVPDRYAESVVRYYQSLSRRPESR